MLGREIRSGAPASSWPQIQSAANTPSQHLFIGRLLNRFDEDPEFKEKEFTSFKKFLSGIYDNLKL